MSWTTISPTLIDLIGKLAVNPARQNSPKFKAEWEEGKRAAMHTGQAQAVTLKVTSLRDVGIPRVTFTEDSSKPAGQNVQPSVLSDVIFVLNIRVEMPTREDDHWAFTTMQRIRSGFWMPSTQAAFLAANLGLVRVMPVTKVSARYDDRIHSIATMDVEFATVMSDEDPIFVGWIETIELTSHVTANEELGVPPNFVDVLIPEPASTSSVSPIELWILDNSPYPSGQSPDGSNVATLWGYSSAQIALGEYDGPPARVIQLPTGAGRGHGFSLLPTGHMIVSTSEDTATVEEPFNYRESWFLVEPGASGVLDPSQAMRFKCGDVWGGVPPPLSGGLWVHTGARDVAVLGDGSILLGRQGVWVICTLEQMLADEINGLPIYSSLFGGSYDLAVVPGTQTVAFQAENAVSWIDFSQGPGPDRVTNRILYGDNVGRPFSEGWHGFIALDAKGGLWKQRGAGTPIDIAYWDAATLATLPATIVSGSSPTSATNLPPTKTLTSPVFNLSNGPLDGESVFVGLDLDARGGLWTTTRAYGAQRDVRSRAYHFSAASVAAGGSQIPDCTITLPALSQPMTVRLDPRFALLPR